MSILPYQLEPAYSSSEEIEDHVSDSEEEEIGDLELPSGENRATHTSWCLCERCAVMPTKKECVCCKEIAFLSKVMKGLSCITEHESFPAVCLNREVLWTALVSLHDRESAGLPRREQLPTRTSGSLPQLSADHHRWLTIDGIHGAKSEHPDFFDAAASFLLTDLEICQGSNW
ncbi:hypothetical protein P5673_032518 [Acropora cervicornis]|uniref:P2X purinoreceptor 7 intracellular domain-containing protein n=1 Tax=Acropora cervicornis TaxID=6130 RepID=A0AAD9PR42_ACRCE|nr:hypothetical protein P5673_032518 [Acropora cervicornis]